MAASDLRLLYPLGRWMMARVYGRHPRIACLVPFCRCGATCYAPHEAAEIICPKHYRLVDRALKARRRRVRRLLKRAGQLNSLRGQMLDDRLWARIRAQAIERAWVVE